MTAQSHTVRHDPNGPRSNVLCLNGSAHSLIAHNREAVTCPACLMILKTGCTATEAIKAWKQ